MLYLVEKGVAGISQIATGWDERVGVDGVHTELDFVTRSAVEALDGWKIRVFVDAGDLDYVDSAEAPDGRRWEFEDDPQFGPGRILRDLERVLAQCPMLEEGS